MFGSPTPEKAGSVIEVIASPSGSVSLAIRIAMVGAAGATLSMVSSSSSDWALRFPAASKASALKGCGPSTGAGYVGKSVKSSERIVNPSAVAGMMNVSMTTSPSLIMTSLFASAETRTSTVVRFVTSSRSEAPVSLVATRSSVGRCGTSVSTVMSCVTGGTVILPAASSISSDMR